MKDKFTKVEYYEIDYSSLDELLKEEYQLDDFETALEQSNDSVFQVWVDGQFDEWDEEQLKEFFETQSQEYSTVSLLLNDLCRKGKIDSGNYLIKISW